MTGTAAHRRRPDDVTRFWAGASVSFLGSEVTTFALPLVGALWLHVSATEMGYLAAAGTLPNTFVSVLAGPLVDRVPKRGLLVTLDLCRALLAALVPLLAALSVLSLPALLGIAFVLGCANAVGDIGSMAYVPVIAGDRLLVANSRIEGSYSAAQAAGPGLGGLLVQAFSAPVAMLADAVSFLWSAVATRSVSEPGRPERAADGGEPGGFVADLRDGARHLRRNRALLLLALSSGAFNLFSAGAAAVFAFYAVRVLGVGSGWFGLAVAAGGAGGVAAAAVVTKVSARVGVPALMSGALLVAAGADLLLLACRDGAGWDPAVIAVSQGIAGAAVTAYVVTNLTLRQQLTPRSMLGSVYGLLRTVTRGAMPLGALIGGAIAGLAGVRAELAFAGVGQALVASVLVRRRQLLDVPAAEPPVAESPVDAAILLPEPVTPADTTPA